MVKVAEKLSKDLPLTQNELNSWVTYNFLVFPSEEQEKIKKI